MKRDWHHPERPAKPSVWRSLSEWEETPAFREMLEREFSSLGSTGAPPLSKRDFLRLMGASLILGGAGLTAGCRRPEAHMVPFNQGVEWSVPGKFLYYATAMPTREGAIPLIASTVDGRPTKLEGNPLHPASNGGTDAFAQASVLDLYDPHRAREIRCGGKLASLADFTNFLSSQHGQPGIAVLAGRSHSPTRDRLRTELEAGGVLWSEYEPLGNDSAEVAITAAFGQGVELAPRFARADVVLALDSDFLGEGGRGPAYAAGFFTRRNPDQRAAPMNRLYVVENHFSVTGGMADHRYRCKASLIGEAARRIARQLAARTDDPRLAAILGACPQVEAPLDERWLAECANDLLANAGRSIIMVGGGQPVWVQSLVLAMNGMLGNLGATMLGMAVSHRPAASLDDLAAAIRRGNVRTLFILGGNPAYNAPADIEFSRLLKSVPTVVRHGLFEDETSRLAAWNVPAAHYLESWGDERTFDGTYTAIQPMILPLWGGVAELDILAQLAGRSAPAGPDLIKETFSILRGGDSGWTDFLRNGFVPGTAWATAPLQLDISRLAQVMAGAEAVRDNMELVFLASASVDDGRYANNAWLQETPDFVTKVAWGNVALVSPATGEKLGLRRHVLEQTPDGPGSRADMIEIRAGETAVKAAVLIAPGHADDSISLALGYGRKDVSALMENVGYDVYPLRMTGAMRFRTGISVRLTGDTALIACTQEQRSMEGRDLVRQGTLEQYRDDPRFAEKREVDHGGSSPHLSAQEQWGMAIDLTTCVGCNACLVACQAENNVPVVGPEQVRRSRDMAWLRIDRYFAGDPDDPGMLAQPVMCQQCENAPCETVCPVNATVHNEEGLNLMVYNRCIGTRYCANNCPWKVRRFNFFDYNERPLDRLYDGPLAPKGMAESLKMVKNPNVTVRMRGVMEKCTFCIQRIEEAKISRLVKAGAGSVRSVPLPEIKTACQQACPSGSLVFGNINDPQSRVSRMRQSGRGYTLLDYLNARPRITYLARIKNPNPRMPGVTRREGNQGEGVS